MRKFASLVAATVLVGCGNAAPLAKQETNGVRYAYYPPSGGMPAVLLDTYTGCLETFIKLTSLDNPKDVSWARKYEDGSLPRGAASDFNSRPPQRCPEGQGENK